MARYGNKKKKEEEEKKKKQQSVSARAMRNEKARQANAGKTVKSSKSTSGKNAKQTKTVKKSANRSSRTMGNNKGLFANSKLFNNKKSEKKSTTSKKGGSALSGIKDKTNDDGGRVGRSQLNTRKNTAEKKQTTKKNSVTDVQTRSSKNARTDKLKNLTTGNLRQVVADYGSAISSMRAENKEDYEKPFKGKYSAIVQKPSYENTMKVSKAVSDWSEKQSKKAQKEIEKGKKDLGKVGQFAADVYGAGLGLAADALTGAAPVSMFARSYGSSYRTAKQEGASHKQAVAYGATKGAVEAATEKMASVAKPLQKIYGKGVADDLTERVLKKVTEKAKTQTGKNLAYHGGKTAASFVSEALEEMVAEGLDPVIANTIYAEEVCNPHSTTMREIARAGLVGGALGGLLGAGGQVVEYNQGSIVSDIYGNDGVKELAKTAKDSDDDADALTAEALDQMINEGGGIAAGQALQLKRAVEKQNAKDREKIQIINDSARNVMRNEGLVDIIKKIDENGTLELSDNARTVYEGAKAKAIDVVKNDSKMQLPDETVDEITSEVASIITGAVTDIDTVNMFTTSNTLARQIYEQTTGETLPATNRETREYLYNKIALNRKVLAEAETGYTMDKIKGVLQQDVAKTYDANGQATFSRVMQEVDVRNGMQVNNSIVTFEDYYEAGRVGISLQEMADLKNPVYDILTPQQKIDAYNAGVRDGIGARNFAAERAKDIKLALGQKVELNQSQLKSVAPRGKVIYEFEDVDNKAHFTASQQTMFQKLAQEFNINIHVTDNPNYNGNYVDGEMWLSVDADRDLKYVFSHEITHHMEKFAPEEYQDFKDLVRTAWGPENLNAAIRAKQKHYANHGVTLSREAAIDEILADSTYEMIQDPAFVTELCNEDRGLAKRIFDALRNLIAKIRNMLAGNDFTPAQNAGLLSQLDILKDAERLWEIGLKKAAENRNVVGVVETNGVQYSEHDYDNADLSVDGHVYDYDFLVNLPDMNIVNFPEIEDIVDKNGKIDRKNIAAQGLANVAVMSETTGLDIVKNTYTGRELRVTGTSIRHGLNGNNSRMLTNARAGSVIGEIIKNAVPVNALHNTAKNVNVKGTYAMVGYAKDSDNRNFVIVITVEQVTGNVTYEVVHSLAGRAKTSKNKNSNLADTKSQGLIPSEVATISIADLLEIVNETHKSILSNDVLSRLGENRPAGGYYTGRAKFSLKDSIEETKELIAVHNIYEDKFLKTLKLGGFPMPSIAVTKAELGHEGFGPISCLFRKDTIDPKNRKNKVFGADAWTPTFPRVDYELNEEKAGEIYHKANQVKGAAYFNATDFHPSNLADKLGSGEEGLIDRYKDDYGMKQMFIVDNGGIPVSYVEEEVRKEMDETEKEEAQYILDNLDNEIISKTANLLPSPPTRKRWAEEYQPKVEEVYEKYLRENFGVDDEGIENIFSTMTTKDFWQMTKRAHRYKETGGITVEERTNHEETRRRIDEQVDKKHFEEWLKNLFAGIEESSGVWNGKDFYTPSGNRRSFAQTHWPVTVDNIVKAMLAQSDSDKNSNSYFVGIKTVRAAAATDFKSIDEIKAQSDRLQKLDNEEFENLKEELDNRLYAVIFEIVKATRPNDNHFIMADNVGLAIEESCSNPTFENIKSILKKYSWNVTDEQVKEIQSIIAEVANMPVNMFEAKPQRVVGFDEIQAVILPDNVSEELKTALQDNSIEFVEYEAGNEQDRLAKVNDQAEAKDIRFSFKDGINVSVDDVNEYVNSHPEEFEEVMMYFYSEQQAHHTKQQTIGELKSQLEKMKADKKVTRGRVLDPKSIEEDANSLVRMMLSYKEDNTKLTDHKLVKMIQKNAKTIFAYLKEGNQEEAVLTAYHAAEELIHNLNMANDEMFFEYKELRDYLRNTRVYIPSEYLGDFPDLAEFRKQQMGRIRLVNEESGGVSVDRMYEQLLEMFPGMFDETLDNPADQMYEIKEVREQLDPYEIVLNHEETEQLIKEAAHDILELAVNGKPWKSWADRNKEVYDEKIKALKQKHQEALRDVRLKEKERAEKKIEAVRAKADERLRQAKEKGEQKLQEEKQKSKERQQAQRDNRNSREYIRKMEKQISWLSERLLKPTDDKHLPEGYQKAIAQILCALDTQSERSKKLEEKYGVSQKRLKFLALKEQYEKIAQQPDNDILMDEDIANDLSQLAEMLEDQTIAEATPQQLEQIYKVLRNITHGIRMVNQAFVEGQRATISEMAEATIEVAENKKRHIDRSGMIGGIDSILNESMVTPRDFFERIGGGIEQAYTGIRKGFDRHVDNITVARTFFEGMFKKYYNKKNPGSAIEAWRDTSTNETFELDAGGSITLNVAQRMSLYCLMKREQAQGHILGSGIVATEVDLKSKLGHMFGAKMDVKASAARITWYDIDNILNTLTPEQIQIADELMRFLNNECAAWGNEVSMRLYGYEKFTEENYFPIKSADVYLDSKFDGRSSVERIRNFGFTKGTVVNANNPIVIDDIFTVVADHINHMSMYSGFAAPIADFTRVYNYKARAEDGTIIASTKAALQDTYGKKVGSYITKFMSDLQSNTQTRTEGVTRLVNKTLANYKKATIAGNLRVALQQPTAIARAYMLISPKYFTKLNAKDNMQRMKEHCQVARWKAWGHNQVDMARDIDDIMMNNEWTKLDLVTMKIYGALDMVTWSYIWGAVENETRKLHPDVEVDSEEYFEICNDRASEIFDKTQVVDSVLHRSEVMRNQDTMSKMVTSFMAEPTRTYNMVRGQYAKALDQWHDGEKGKATATAAKTTYIFLLNAMLCAMAAAVADALRGKDLDDDDEPEEWIEHVMNNFIGNANPLMMVPVMSEVMNYWQGWGSQNMALEGIEALITATKALHEKMNGGKEDKTWGELIRKEAEAAGLVFGIPVKNILRELETFGKLIGYEASAATKGTETDSTSLLEELDELDIFSVKDGSFVDNILNRFGWNLTEAEKQERARNELIKQYESKLNGLSGKDREEKMWSLVTRGYTTDLKNGDLAAIEERRKILEAMGGDLEYFDERVKSNTIKAYKKTIGTDDAVSAVLKDFLKSKYGYTDGKISTEIIAKSDYARQFQLAVCANDEDAAIETLSVLIDAGITDEDAYVLFLNKYDAIKATDYVTGEMSAPVSGRVTSTFGYRDAPTAGASTYHEGMDIAAPAGTTVGAADGGKVSSCGYNKTEGYFVRISHGNGRYTEYKHLEGYCVWKGQPVAAGQEIGKVGSTGVSTGPHLHFSVKESGVYVDPAPYLK